MRRLSVVLILLLWICTGAAKTISGKVIAVKDGDTIVVLKNKSSYTIRLDGIDCPEKRQAFGDRAKRFASDRVFGKQVRVQYSKKDRYQRYLGDVYYNGNKCLNRELLKAGLAWHYKQYNKNPELAKLEQNARKRKEGLWADAYPKAPWDFRRTKKPKNKA
ncbi:MAG: thermonuclease family protein [Candidatus Cloacimonetes bacterium]|nr:thermonuclease family protein [Candidatus Cloacimonadota bacterium]